MVLESSQQPVKRWRGRPRKTPIVEAKVSHKAPSKASSRAVDAAALSREEELAAFEKRSNKSGVLTLLVLLLWIALIGYGMYLKLHQANSEKEDDMDNVPVKQNTTVTPPASGTKPTTPAPTTSNSIIQDYFTRVNNGQFETLAAIQDSSFKTLWSLRNYFNNTRLETFVKNTIGWIRIEGLTENTTDPAIKRNPTAKAYDFTMAYTLKSNEQEYREPWRAYTILKDSGVVINGFVYEWTGISQSPFFQFSKFGIK